MLMKMLNIRDVSAFVRVLYVLCCLRYDSCVFVVRIDVFCTNHDLKCVLAACALFGCILGTCGLWSHTSALEGSRLVHLLLGNLEINNVCVTCCLLHN